MSISGYSIFCSCLLNESTQTCSWCPTVHRQKLVRTPYHIILTDLTTPPPSITPSFPQIDKHQLATQFERLRLEGDGPLGQQKAPAPSCVFGGAGRLVSSLFISRPSAGGRLRTLSLDVGLAGCKGDEMQGAVAALLESGACPELRRLWLFPGDLLGDEEVVDDGTGAGGKSGFCVGGVAVVSEAGDRDTGEYNVGAAADSTGNRGESPPDKVCVSVYICTFVKLYT